MVTISCHIIYILYCILYIGDSRIITKRLATIWHNDLTLRKENLSLDSR